MPRVTPYQRLKDATIEYIGRVKYPHRKTMWLYPKDKLNLGWKLGDLSERVKAADQLGYDVRLRINDDGLIVEYVKRPKDINYWL